ncbi:MAG: YceI family protein [Bdellovibrionales bacterium]|nr:YceI family protein [Bdellovibrionales bacterium]
MSCALKKVEYTLDSVTIWRFLMRPTRPLTLLAYALTVLGFSVVSVSQSAHADVRKLEIDKEKSVVQWLGKKVSGQHNGTLNIKSGTVSLDGEQIVGGSFVLDMNTIANEDIESPKWKAKLEEHLKSNDFFNIAKFPEGTFEITKSEPGEQPSDVLLTGKLTVKGLTFPITFPAKVTKTGDSYEASGKVTLDRTKWEIKYNSGKWYDPAQLGDKLIYDDIEIEVRVATKQM